MILSGEFVDGFGVVGKRPAFGSTVFSTGADDEVGLGVGPDRCGGEGLERWSGSGSWDEMLNEF